MSARNPFLAPEVKSRRGGPAKQPLSRDIIVRSTLDLLTQEGIDQVSLRKVAASLDTGPASLYAYVEDLQELYALVLDRALGDVETVGNPRRDWRQRLDALLQSYYHALSRSLGLAQLALTMIAIGPNALRIAEALLGLLEEAGIDKATSAWAVDVITLYVTAVAAEHSHHRKLSNQLKGSVSRAMFAVSEADYPRVYAVREEFLSAAPDRFTWAIDALIAGILETPRTLTKDKPKSTPSRTRKKATKVR
jgi:AcrR family transcriptional regulator